MARPRLATQALTRVSISISEPATDPVMELLGEFFGQPASVYTDARTQRTVASVFLSRPSAWSATRQRDLQRRLRELRHVGIDLGSGRIGVTKVAREDWAESWKRHFKPLDIGGALLIKPSWSKRKPTRGQAIVVLDPGLSFGTGQHPTTRFCLEQLAAARKSGPPGSLLDIGTGSGILAIAAVKLGYRPVDAFDFDPVAVRIARLNARQNGIATRLRPLVQDLTKIPVRPARQYDVLCANLTDDLLLAERPRILARLKPTGRLILAGVLRKQFGAVRRAFEGDGLQLVAQERVQEWQSGAFAWA